MSVFPTEVKISRWQNLSSHCLTYIVPVQSILVLFVESIVLGPWNWATIPFLPQGMHPWISLFPQLDHSLLICEIRALAGRFMRSLSALWVSVCVWLNGGRIAASQLDAITLFPNPGWLHGSAPRLGMDGPIAFPRSVCQNQSHLLWDIWGQYFPNFFL